MSRVLLVHWNAAECAERAALLRRAGHFVASHSDEGGGVARAVRENPPDAVVIDLARIPSHGRAVAVWLRQQKATRRVPIVFVEGDPEKTQRVRGALPDAVFTTWGGIRGAVRRAIREAPAEPVVPGTMDAYSGTPLPKKLGIREGSAVALVGAPDGFERTLGALPAGARVRRGARARADILLLFARSRADLARRFPAAARALAAGGRLWIVWPKKASGVASDLGETEVRAFGLAAQFVDYKIAAIDATWSGLCFARRRANEIGH